MKKSAFLVLVVVVLIAVLSVSAVSAQGNGRQSYIVVGQNAQNMPASLVNQLRARGAAVDMVYAKLGMVSVTTANPDALESVPGVRSVVPNIQFHVIDPVAVEALPGGFSVPNPPNTGDDDFYFDLQWGHDAVNAPEAWAKYGARGAGVRVFVLDSGIDATHPDLAPNVNTALSKSFVPGEDWQVQPGFYFNHGTHVAGTIAAADNAYGVIGVAPEAEIVALKVLSEYTGSGDFDWLVDALIYAGDNGADVINMSLGAVIPVDDPDLPELAYALGRATSYAYHRGATIIASSGNSGIDFDANPDLVDLPAMAPFVLGISATAPIGWGVDPATNLDIVTYYSNIGNVIVDFSAPGGSDEYYYVDPAAMCTVAGTTRPCFVFDYVFSAIPGGWAWAAGTSMAAPHASGVAAQIIGLLGGSAKPWNVISYMWAGSNDLGAPGTDPLFGIGRVNIDWSQRG
jgi:subtilisin family serine protease